jgi:hypothetical protein
MKYFVLIFCTIPLICMETEENFRRSRSDSLTCSLQARGIMPVAYDAVHLALNGNTDDHVITIVNTAIIKNYYTKIYPDLREQRKKLVDNITMSRDEVITYLVHELTECNSKNSERQRKERHMKYNIALIGACATCSTALLTTLLSSGLTAIMMYYLA